MLFIFRLRVTYVVKTINFIYNNYKITYTKIIINKKNIQNILLNNASKTNEKNKAKMLFSISIYFIYRKNIQNILKM